jgi:hypothetical protein
MSYTQTQGTSGPQADKWRPRPYARSWNRRPHDAQFERNDERRSESSRAASRYQTSRSASPPDSPVRTGTLDSRRDSLIDVKLLGRRAPAAPSVSQPHEVVPGVIMFVPKGLKVRDCSPSMLLQDQPWVNEHATGHPVVVWDTYKRGDELIARCLPMTSFGGRRVEEKYDSAGAWKHWLEYVPIMQDGVAVASDANMPSLALADGETMRLQTYVHLDHFFDIEVEFLHPHCRNARSGRSVHLEDAALSVLVFKFHQFISGETRRPRAWIRSPLDSYGRYAPVEKLARPELGQEARVKADIGRELEAARHEAAGTREWTGKEPLGPHQQAEQDRRDRMS